MIGRPDQKRWSALAACALLVSARALSAQAWSVTVPSLGVNGSIPLPATDPVAVGSPAEYSPTLLAEHPRTLFSKSDLPRLRAFYASEAGRPWRLQLIQQAAARAPTTKLYLTDATEAQRQALWRLPSLALYHLLTGDPASLGRAVEFLQQFLADPDWDLSYERNSGMGGANLLAGTALAYDWLWPDLDPSFREALRQKLWLQARAMYYGGHLQMNPPAHFWQQDVQNNHRWHADAGLALAVLAAYDGQPGQTWLVERLRSELEFVAKGLPSDGSTHESGAYLAFGGAHLVMGFDAADRCLGTHLLEIPFFHNNPSFRLGLLGNGFTGDPLDFGDWSGSSLGAYNAYLFRLADRGNQPDIEAALHLLSRRRPEAFPFGWLNLIWDTDRMPPAPPAMPLFQSWRDIGLAVVRTTQEPGGVALRFKCGPLGGSLLNQTQHASPGDYVNVAHDDPDANSFVLTENGRLVAETDRYSLHKASRNQNTILVNGVGQTDTDGVEGVEWTQPRRGSNDADVRLLTATQQGTITVMEGEAAAAYPALKMANGHPQRPALKQYRRIVLWVEGQYVLVADTVKAAAPAEITWLIQSPKLEATGNDGRSFVLSAGPNACPLTSLASIPLQRTLRPSPADDHGHALGWTQLCAVGYGETVQFATLLSPWTSAPPTLATNFTANGVTLTVTTARATDTWTIAVEAGQTPAHITGTRSAGGAAATVLYVP